MSESDDRVIPDRTTDEDDVGWGDEQDDDVRRFTDDVPPHHLDLDRE